jgi:hypothetical protein
MAEITVDDAVRLHLAEWLIVLLSLPDPPPPDGALIREVAALEVISAATQFLGEGQVREGIQTALTPYASTRTEQLREQLNTKARPFMQTEAFAGVAQGGVGFGGLTEWDLLAMILAGQRKGKLPRVQA